MIELIEQLKEGRTWREVAQLIARISGVRKSDAWWLQVARGDKSPRREDINAVRRCFPGWPDLPPTAGELAAEYGVERAVLAAEHPDTALLVEIGDVPVRHVVIESGDENSPVYVATSRLATVGSKPQAKRTRANPSVIVTMEKIALLPPSAFSTVRGKTGNLAAIAEAARAAAVELGGVSSC